IHVDRVLASLHASIAALPPRKLLCNGKCREAAAAAGAGNGNLDAARDARKRKPDRGSARWVAPAIGAIRAVGAVRSVCRAGSWEWLSLAEHSASDWGDAQAID